MVTGTTSGHSSLALLYLLNLLALACLKERTVFTSTPLHSSAPPLPPAAAAAQGGVVQPSLCLRS